MHAGVHGAIALSVGLLAPLVGEVSAAGAGEASGPAAVQQQVPAPATPGEGLTLLPLRAYQQTTSYTCGPAALITLLRYYQRDADEMETAKGANCTPDKGTTPQNMVAWLERQGFDVTWGEHGSLDLLRANLAKGIPTIVEWIDWGGHWVVVVGYDTKGNESTRDDVIYFADPADGVDGTRDGLTSSAARRFDAMWFDAFLFERPMFKVYIIAVPKPAPVAEK